MTVEGEGIFGVTIGFIQSTYKKYISDMDKINKRVDKMAAGWATAEQRAEKTLKAYQTAAKKTCDKVNKLDDAIKNMSGRNVLSSRAYAQWKRYDSILAKINAKIVAMTGHQSMATAGAGHMIQNAAVMSNIEKDIQKNVDKVTKSHKKQEKQLKGVNKQAGFLNSRFAKFSIIMSGIAATLFVFQQAVQIIKDLASASIEAENAVFNLNRYFGELGDSATSAEGLYNLPVDLNKSIDLMKELYDLGYKGQEALDIFPQVVDYSFFTDIRTAADAATDDILGSRRELDKLVQAYDKSTEKSVQLFKNKWTELKAFTGQLFIAPIKGAYRGTEGKLREELAELEKSLATGAPTVNSMLFGDSFSDAEEGAANTLARIKEIKKELESFDKNNGPSKLINHDIEKKALETIYKSTGYMSARLMELLTFDLTTKAESFSANVSPEFEGLISKWLEKQFTNIEYDKLLSNKRIISTGQQELLQKLFQDTGHMSSQLYKQLLIDNEIQANRDYDKLYGQDKATMEDGNAFFNIRPNNVKARHVAENLKLFKQYNETRMSGEEAYYEETGIMSKELADYKFEVMNKEHDLRMLMGMDEAKSMALAKKDITELINLMNPDKMAGGLNQGVQDFIDSTKNVFEDFRDFSKGIFDDLSDIIVDFTTTGELDFKSMVESMMSSWLSMVTRMAMADLLEGNGNWLTNFFTNYNGNSNIQGDASTGLMPEGGYRSSVINARNVSNNPYELHSNEHLVSTNKLKTNDSDGVSSVQVVLNEAKPDTQVRQEQHGNILRIILDQASNEVANGGKLGRTIKNTFNLSRKGY